MTLLARNEEDIIREHILYHLSQGVDFIIATDNLSTDSTTEILHEFEKMGVLHYIYQGNDNHNQTEWVTHMARMAAARYQADWVLNSDADEFWWPTVGDLKSTLKKIPLQQDAISVERKNFMPTKIQTEPFYKRMIVRELSSKNYFGAPLPPKALHRASEEVTVSNGNHFIRIKGPITHHITNEIEIFHFPVRSWSQFQSKIIYGAEALNRNLSLNKKVGATWRHLYKLNIQGELINYYNSLIVNPEELNPEEPSANYQIDKRLLDYFQNVVI